MSAGIRHLQVVKSGARYKWFGKGGAKKTAMDTTTGKAPRFYPADDIPVPRKSARTVQKVSVILLIHTHTACIPSPVLGPYIT